MTEVNKDMNRTTKLIEVKLIIYIHLLLYVASLSHSRGKRLILSVMNTVCLTSELLVTGCSHSSFTHLSLVLYVQYLYCRVRTEILIIIMKSSSLSSS